MCVPWESNPQPFALLTQCSTTEPREQLFNYLSNFKRCCSLKSIFITKTVLVIKIDLSEQQLLKLLKYKYNSNDAIIISSNKVSKARNHMVYCTKLLKYILYNKQ